ncbi:MAG: TerB family tellurite resistance protein [Woeseiaceae bacterium]
MSDTIITSRLEGTTLIVETDDSSESYDSQFLVAALLIFVARGSGGIAPEESAKMLDLIQVHFQLQGAESLELLTRAMSELAEKPELGELLAELGRSLSDTDKEDIAVMALKVIAADGRREVAEMEKFNQAVEAVGVSPEIVHRAFDRYFAETMPGGE